MHVLNEKIRTVNTRVVASSFFGCARTFDFIGSFLQLDQICRFVHRKTGFTQYINESGRRFTQVSMKYSANPCVKKEVQIDDHVRPSCHSICDSYEIHVLKKEGETTEDPVCRNHLATSKKQITAYLSHLCLRKKSCHAFLRDYFKLKEKKSRLYQSSSARSICQKEDTSHMTFSESAVKHPDHGLRSTLHERTDVFCHPIRFRRSQLLID
jgi:hypothetical protein